MKRAQLKKRYNMKNTATRKKLRHECTTKKFQDEKASILNKNKIEK